MVLNIFYIFFLLHILCNLKDKKPYEELFYYSFNYTAANELICYYFSFIKLFQKFLRVLF